MGHVRNYTIGDVWDLNHYKDLMFCILWVGTHLVCQRNATRQNNLDPKLGQKPIFLI